MLRQNFGITNNLQDFLDNCVEKYNQPEFIAQDPISLPHRFSRLQDREIIGFWIAMLAWGQRAAIIKSGSALCTYMDDAPYDFMRHHQETDRQRFLRFVHRTFNATDALYFLHFFQQYYQQHESLEDAFSRHLTPESTDVKAALVGFHNLFFELPDAPERTRKHIATPARQSACKRLNMFLRWMVRSDDKGVDFGVWQRIAPAQLIVPLDVHVQRIALQLGLLTRTQADWQAAQDLTEQLRQFDPHDPCKYDFALFGLGLSQKQLPFARK